MSKILTDKKLIDKFLNRGVEKIYPSRNALYKALTSGRRLRIYQGFDPTGPYLHIGHAIGIRALRVLQQLGHEVIFLVGDFTAKIGDPDKKNTRKLLSNEDIRKNMANWKKQASQLIDFNNKENPVRFEGNYKWLSKIKLYDLLKLASHMTLQRILERDLFKRRIKNEDPIRLHELVYPLMQGYDSVAMEVDIEIGGTDQTFNMLVGRDLVKSYLGKEKFVRTHKMISAPSNQTMSKSKRNGINLSDGAKEIYGKVMSYSDEFITEGLELLTDVPMKDIEQIKKEIKAGVNPMQFKKLMAFEVTKIIKGDKKAIESEREFNRIFKEKKLPSKIKEIKIAKKEINILDLLVMTKLASSKSEAKRLIEQNAVKIDGIVKQDWKEIIKIEKGMIVKAGKRKFIKIA